MALRRFLCGALLVRTGGLAHHLGDGDLKIGSLPVANGDLFGVCGNAIFCVETSDVAFLKFDKKLTP